MTLREVALTVSTHLALNARNCWVQEMVRAFYFGWYDRFVTKLPPLLKGEVTIPDGPGLGLQLQPDVAKRRVSACGAQRPWIFSDCLRGRLPFKAKSRHLA